MKNLKSIINAPSTIILDVRSPGEYMSENFPGAINIPLDEIQKRIDEIKEMKGPIVTYCRSGARSDMATTILKRSGIPEVYNAGGLDEILKYKN